MLYDKAMNQRDVQAAKELLDRVCGKATADADPELESLGGPMQVIFKRVDSAMITQLRKATDGESGSLPAGQAE